MTVGQICDYNSMQLATIARVVTDQLRSIMKSGLYVLPVGESNVIGEEDHSLSQFLSTMVPKRSTLPSKPHMS